MKKMKIENLLYSLVIALCFGFSACEETPVVIPDFVAPTSDRVLIIEEFTGVDCGPCPAGAAEIEDMLNRFPDNLVAVGIHSGALAKPVDGSIHDYKTEKGQNIYSELGAFATPLAAVSRIRFDGQTREALFTPWTPYVVEALEAEPFAEAYIELENNFDFDTRMLTINVDVLPQVNLSGDLRLTLMMVQKSIIDAQNVNGTIELDYEHKHVLLDIVTDWNGDSVANSMSQGELYEYQYSFQVPEEDQGLWKVSGLSVVGFIANVSTDSKEVIQATEEFISQ